MSSFAGFVIIVLLLVLLLVLLQVLIFFHSSSFYECNRIELGEIDHFTLSSNTDNIVIIISPATSDYIFSARRKTEIFAQVLGDLV
jgi:hypothetical protein